MRDTGSHHFAFQATQWYSLLPAPVILCSKTFGLTWFPSYWKYLRKASRDWEPNTSMGRLVVKCCRERVGQPTPPHTPPCFGRWRTERQESGTGGERQRGDLPLNPWIIVHYNIQMIVFLEARNQERKAMVRRAQQTVLRIFGFGRWRSWQTKRAKKWTTLSGDYSCHSVYWLGGQRRETYRAVTEAGWAQRSPNREDRTSGVRKRGGPPPMSEKESDPWRKHESQKASVHNRDGRQAVRNVKSRGDTRSWSKEGGGVNSEEGRKRGVHNIGTNSGKAA